jgi:hypothetical protein
MADKKLYIRDAESNLLPLLAHDNGDGSYSLGTAGAAGGGDATAANQATLIATLGAAITTKDGGAAWTKTQTYTTSADMTTAAAISAAPTSGQKIVADDILISALTALEFTLQEETSNTVLASVLLPANGSAQITLRDGLKVPTADRKLYGKASAAGQVRITACYHSE